MVSRQINLQQTDLGDHGKNYTFFFYFLKPLSKQTNPFHNKIAKCQVSGCLLVTSAMLTLNCMLRTTAKDAEMVRGCVQGQQKVWGLQQ